MRLLTLLLLIVVFAKSCHQKDSDLEAVYHLE